MSTIETFKLVSPVGQPGSAWLADHSRNLLDVDAEPAGVLKMKRKERMPKKVKRQAGYSRR